jgi:hypothetical protein
MYTIFFISFVVSSTCFGCYLHPSPGAQLQRTAIGCVWLWCVIPLEQVLVWDSFTLKHGQLQTGVGRFCKACTLWLSHGAYSCINMYVDAVAVLGYRYTYMML